MPRIELGLVETAQTFWQEAGGRGLDFEFALACTLPLSVQRLPNLSLTTMRQWFSQRHIIAVDALQTLADRPLRACLLALGGKRNFILLDEGDRDDEQLFSLAHEVAHFLLDFQKPRHRTKTLLGTSVLPVLDGLRPATFEERAGAVLGGVVLRPGHHFMERDALGSILSGEVLQAESRADRLALELLAPEELTLPLVKAAISGHLTYAVRCEVAQAILHQTYTLPRSVVAVYARTLVELAGGHKTVQEKFGL